MAENKLKKYRVTVYPNMNSDTYVVEAANVESAIEEAEEIAANNLCFYANEEDVEEIN